MKHSVWIYFALSLALWAGCRSPQSVASPNSELLPISQIALYDSTSLFFGDFGNYPSNLAHAPIGIFDSGTGGLTVMEAIVTLDLFNNSTGEEGADGILDFAGESFIYLADQANMPYGNYSSENKTDYLKELVIQDVLFLMRNRVKSVVVACNTATAACLEDVQTLLEKSCTGVSVTGVINAGVKCALESLSLEESGTIGVMATVGTIKTEGYERTIKEMAHRLGYTGTLQVVNQPAMGFAEAVDEDPDFVLPTARYPRTGYRGPSINHPDHPIDLSLLEAYRFDYSNHAMLATETFGEYTQLQLNSARNYARYHLLSMMEKLRNTPHPQPLKVFIMGCTHYPYHKETLHNMLQELREYNTNGLFPYRDLIAPEVTLVDPAVNTAKELYLLLQKEALLARSPSPSEASFYVTIPNCDLAGVDLEAPNRFTYSYKYGRNPGTALEYVHTVPFSSELINRETLNRFRTTIPVTCCMMCLPGD